LIYVSSAKWVLIVDASAAENMTVYFPQFAPENLSEKIRDLE